MRYSFWNIIFLIGIYTFSFAQSDTFRKKVQALESCKKNCLDTRDSLFEIASRFENLDSAFKYMHVLYENEVQRSNTLYEEMLDKFIENQLSVNSKVYFLQASCKAYKSDIIHFDTHITNLFEALAYKDTSIQALENAGRACMPMNCSIVDQYLKKKFKGKNIATAKEIFALSIQFGCDQDKTFVRALELINEREPNPGSLIKLASGYCLNKEMNKAEQAYNNLIDMAPNDEQKASILIYWAKCHERNNNIRKAFQLADSAATISEDTYTYIYMASLIEKFQSNCKFENSMISSLPYILAYDYYMKGGDEKKALQMKEHFPKKEILFIYSAEAGDTIHIDCPIQHDVVLKTK